MKIHIVKNINWVKNGKNAPCFTPTINKCLKLAQRWSNNKKIIKNTHQSK